MLYVYGCYSFDGANRYDAMENAPKVGDFVVMYGILSAYNGVGQMKNGWLVQLNDVVYGGETPEPGVHEHVACPTCGLCVAEDCDGAEEVKCAGHEAQSAVTVTFVVADVASAQGWDSSSNCLKEAYAIDENISISVAGGSNSGKFYTDHLRIYATDTPAGSITLTAAEGYKIQSVSFGLVTGTYAFLQLDGVTVNNGETVEINAASAVFNTVKNGTNGKQVKRSMRRFP